MTVSTSIDYERKKQIVASLGPKLSEESNPDFSVRQLLREYMKLHGFEDRHLHAMKVMTMVKAYNSPSYMAAVTRGRIRKDANYHPDGNKTPQVMQVGINEDHVRRLIGEAMAKNGGNVNEARIVELIHKHTSPTVIKIERPRVPTVTLKGRRHPCFERVLKLASQGANVMLVGPAGCGKTHMAEQIAKSLKLDYGAIHGTAGASESSLTGWLLPGKGGNFEYTPAPFVTLFEQGDSLFLFDEVDGFDSNMLLIMNGALANGYLHIPHRRGKPVVNKGENVFILATANTYGTGANPMYAGRSPLDAATLDRFVIVTMDYDESLERDLGKAAGLVDLEMQQLWTLRKRVREASLRRVISTRAFQKAGIMKAAGDDWKTVMSTLTEGWTRDEKQKIGVV